MRASPRPLLVALQLAFAASAWADPLSLTISGLSASNKVYDGGFSAVITGSPQLVGVQGTDSVVLLGSVTSGTFAARNVGVGIVVTPDLSGLSLTGTDAGRYAITGMAIPLTANISPFVLSNVTVPDKIYSESQSNIGGNSGLIGGETLSTGTITFNGSGTITVGEGGNVTNHSLSLTAGNYVITQASQSLPSGIDSAGNYTLTTATLTAGGISIGVNGQTGGTVTITGQTSNATGGPALTVTSSPSGSYTTTLTLSPTQMAAAVLSGIPATPAPLTDLLSSTAPGASTLLTALSGLDTASRQQAVRELQPESNGARRAGAQAAQNTLFNAFDSRVALTRSGGALAQAETGLAAGDRSDRRVWMQGLAGQGRQGARQGADGYQLEAYGLAAGLEWDRDAQDFYGLSLGYTKADVNGRDNSLGDGVRVGAAHLGGYFSRTTVDDFLDASLVVSFNRYDGQRLVNILGATETESARYNGHQTTLRLEYGRPLFAGPESELRWLVGGRVGEMRTEAYTESGGVGAQQVAAQRANTVQSVVGVDYRRRMDPISNLTLRARYLHEFSDAPATQAQFVNGGGSFTVDAVQPARDALQLGVGYRRQLAGGGVVTLAYDAELKDHFFSQQLSFKAQWTF